MSFMSKLKQLFANCGNSAHGSSFANSTITIAARSDGLTASGLPPFINPAVKDVPNSILCNEGTTLHLQPLSSLVTGTSSHRQYVLQMQIANAVCNG